ncbi:tRNA pseudouridine(55) synthase TruB [Patescibacteria group bacterium]|nr:tRNA pseudouridine(55) synthase TruB [Patescibacteria group bacterium]
MQKVLIAGTFDIIHPGHLNLFKQAKELGDYLVVLVARDKNVIKNKGNKPFFKEAERLKQLSKINLIDKVILGDFSDPYKIIQQQKPDIIALGYDQQVYVAGLYQLLSRTNLSFKITRLKPFSGDICSSKRIRKAMEDKQSGFLLINKEPAYTSHDVVAKLRTLTGIRKIGHTGTLDPLATGVLICAVGKATTLTGLFNVLPKTYYATIKLGVTSDTYDRQGKLSESAATVNISLPEIKNILKDFTGKKQQIPPMFSAKKVNGKKLYVLARQNKIVKRPAQEIEIYQLTIINWQSPFLEIKVICSAGTYIRSLVHDFGQKTGQDAVLWELKRTAIGDFKIEETFKISDNLLNSPNWQEFLIKPSEAINRLNECYVQNVG